MHFVRHKNEINLIPDLAHFIFRHTCDAGNTAKFKIKVVFISHDFRVVDGGFMQAVREQPQVLLIELEILSTDAHDNAVVAL